uniref:Uncharacterized protein n=1 Tax=Arundo donax TaxID=35708 RepID=A0A0A9CBF5_ARUDO
MYSFLLYQFCTFRFIEYTTAIPFVSRSLNVNT